MGYNLLTDPVSYDALHLINYSIIESELIEAIKRLPQLEEMHLTLKDPTLGPEDIETIGVSCPMFKSFTYNSYKCDFYLVFSEHAAAIEEACLTYAISDFVY